MLFVALLAVVLAGCAGSRPSEPEEASEAAGAAAPGVSLAALVEAGRSGDSAALLNRLNPPLRVEEEPVENRHVPGQTDTLRTYHYDGLALTVYDVAGSGKRLFQHLAVTSDAYAPPQDVQIGLRRTAVEEALGPPAERRDGGRTYVYETGDGPTPTLLLVHFEDDAVARMAWSFYVD